MNENLVSVIVPVYNVAQYVAECLNSLLNQTYRNLEIIVVDDGSTDNSLQICNTFLSDTRVKVFHKENGGLSDARNYGLEKATGAFVLFIDSDAFPTCFFAYVHMQYLFFTLFPETAFLPPFII